MLCLRDLLPQTTESQRAGITHFFFGQALREGLQGFLSAYEKLEKEYETAPPPKAYHYTDTHGLAGILKSAEFWLTDIRYLNDPSEFSHAHDFAIGALQAAIRDSNNKEHTREFCHFVLRTQETIQREHRMFVGSFSQRADDLAQWRAYADQGRGAALGLTEQLFASSEIKDDPLKSVVTIKISYDEKIAKEKQEQAVRTVVELLNRDDIFRALQENQESRDEFLPLLGSRLSIWFYFVAVAHKHEAYMAEEEIRLLLINTQDALRPHIRTRIRNGSIVPFTPWKVDPPLTSSGVLNEIWLGPATVPTAEVALHDLLHECAIDPSTLKIHRSTIPYRPF